MTQRKYRTEKWELSYEVESSFGEVPTGSTVAAQLFGVFQDANLPNPRFDHQSFWLQNPSNRNYFVAYKGKAQSAGSIGNIILLNGKPVCLPIANTITHTADGDYYVHTIDETINLPSIRLVATNFDDQDTSPDTLCRWFVGGKVNRAKFHCEEGGMLMMSLGDIPFKMPYFVDSVPTSELSPWYDVDAIAQTITHPCDEPYYFSQGAIKVKLPILGMVEATIPTVRNFSIDVGNGLEPKYYLATNVEKVPYEIFEGRREYSMSLSLDLVDAASTWTKDSAFLELLNQGMHGTTFKGAAFDIKFSKSANDYIQFITPADYDPDCGGESQGNLVMSAPMDIGGQGIINVQLEMKMRNLKIVVKDSNVGTSYPIGYSTVTFDSNGGSGSMADQTANVATALTTNTFTKGTDTFDSWDTTADGSGTSYANGATYSFAANTTLYAQWV